MKTKAIIIETIKDELSRQGIDYLLLIQILKRQVEERETAALAWDVESKLMAQRDHATARGTSDKEQPTGTKTHRRPYHRKNDERHQP